MTLYSNRAHEYTCQDLKKKFYQVKFTKIFERALHYVKQSSKMSSKVSSATVLHSCPI